MMLKQYVVLFQVLGVNLLGWVAIVAWTAAICAPMFLILKALKALRVDPDIELKGKLIFSAHKQVPETTHKYQKQHTSAVRQYAK